MDFYGSITFKWYQNTHADATLSKTKTKKQTFLHPNIFRAAIIIKHGANTTTFRITLQYYHRIQRNIHSSKQEINSKRVQ